MNGIERRGKYDTCWDLSNLDSADVAWFYNKKLLKNTKTLKCRIYDNKTTCIIKEVTHDMAGEYVCKLTSSAGAAMTKAKLHVHGNFTAQY